jgi:hypothetical protein
VIFGIVVLVCLAVAAVLLLRLHSLFTELSPVSGAVDDLGQTRYHPYYRAMVAAMGIAAFVLAVGLARETDATSVAWLSIYGGTRVAIAGVQVDPRQVAAAGRLHVVLLVAGFAAIAVAAWKIHWAGDPGLLRPLGYIVALAAVVALVTRVVPSLERWFGAAERVLYAATILWLAVAGAGLLS